jgi:protoporphyrinogen oxidase
MTAEHTPTLILGAGLSGLSTAFHLQAPYRLLEKSDSVGGLAQTRSRPGGFQCDGTGHWLHLRQDRVRKFVESVLGDNLRRHVRRARIYSHGRFTLYPFQANTYGLPIEVVSACMKGLIRARETVHEAPAAHFEEWILREFGEGICTHFMFPYNRKVYGVPLSSLAANFAETYIPRPNIETVIDGALGLSREALGYNATFLYPAKGGIGAMADAIHQALPQPAERHTEPVAINLDTRTIQSNRGQHIGFEKLVSTIPLPRLIECIRAGTRHVPDAVLESTGLLKASSLIYFDIGVKGAPKEHQDYHWVYVPEPEFPFYRVGSYTAVEPSLAPPGHRSYYVECTTASEVDVDALRFSVIEGLRTIGILDQESEILFMEPNFIQPAYVLYDAGYSKARATVLDWLETQNIIAIGRYGRWQYNAMEDALAEGMEAADRCRT